MKVNSVYGYLMILLLVVETGIALFVRDAFIRPYFGDFLATILVYSILRTFSMMNVSKSLLISVLISYTVEIFQAVDVLTMVGLKSNEIVSTVAGTSFDWGDILAYTLGGISILLFEHKINNTKFYRQ